MSVLFSNRHAVFATAWRVAAWGLGLNALWEFAQAGPFYDMWAEVGRANGLFHITLAILGDVVIVLGVAVLGVASPAARASRRSRRSRCFPPRAYTWERGVHFEKNNPSSEKR